MGAYLGHRREGGAPALGGEPPLAQGGLLRHTLCMAQTIGGFGLKGVGALIVALAALGALFYYAGVFVVLILAAALVAVVVLHYRNQRPVKLPGDDHIRLHLDDK